MGRKKRRRGRERVSAGRRAAGVLAPARPLRKAEGGITLPRRRPCRRGRLGSCPRAGRGELTSAWAGRPGGRRAVGETSAGRFEGEPLFERDCRSPGDLGNRRAAAKRIRPREGAVRTVSPGLAGDRRSRRSGSNAFHLGILAFQLPDLAAARRTLDESAAILRDLKDWRVAYPLSCLGEIDFLQHDRVSAKDRLAEALRIQREVGLPGAVAMSLITV